MKLNNGKKKKPSKKFINCHKLRYTWGINKASFNQMVEPIFKDFLFWTDKKRLTKRSHRKHLELILINLLRTYESAFSPYLSISRSTGDYYKIPSMYLAGSICPLYRASIHIQDFLVEKNYIKKIKHNYAPVKKDSSWRTRFTLSDKLKRRFKKYKLQKSDVFKLKNTEVILLKKSVDKRLINYSDNKLIKEWRSLLHKLNKLHKNTIIKDKDGNILEKQFFFRSFNDSCLTDKSRIKSGYFLGGRFYCGGIQNFKEEDRKLLLFNNSPVVELDYQGLHIHLLYRKLNRNYKGDPYSIPNIPKKHRAIVKAIFLIVINSKSKGNWYKPVRESLKNSKDYEKRYKNIPDATFKRYFKLIQQHHFDITEYFFSGIAKELQYEDSCIAHEIIKEFVEQDIPIVPVHDSFIVPLKYKGKLKKAMAAQFKSYGYIKIK